tara:strand:+ start:118 stop:309 length:192 start_codon:yes stop_codon:yes gene_type:complete
MAEKTKTIVVENTPPKKKVLKKKNDVEFIGNELANVSQRVNELELSIESLRQDIKRVMGRMGL